MGFFLISDSMNFHFWEERREKEVKEEGRIVEVMMASKPEKNLGLRKFELQSSCFLTATLCKI